LKFQDVTLLFLRVALAKQTFLINNSSKIAKHIFKDQQMLPNNRNKSVSKILQTFYSIKESLSASRSILIKMSNGFNLFSKSLSFAAM